MDDYYTSERASPVRYNDVNNQANIPNLQNVQQQQVNQPGNFNIPIQDPLTGQNVQPTTLANPNDPAYRYNSSHFQWDFGEILRRAVKYLIEGLAVAFVAYYFVGKGKLNIRDIVMLGITAAFVFAILDVFSPTVALGARFGAGFGIGQGLFGLNPAVIGGPSIVAPIV
ncbi:hypothetical protein ma382 [Moumouvirus australiensis]|uniref:Uncharacterized protein n=1 Tax=Moumouvirus australiensis TaxID=2109587 RepID=A0A2P1ELN8_9VIRU|nr:hypothetical protein QKC55_gp523 [Moumouvirus australiensis]AVL94768.1 hypothetical protein ma382 [Moumouvirus australiensis]